MGIKLDTIPVTIGLKPVLLGLPGTKETLESFDSPVEPLH